jgi:phosphoribosylglycinamide formyltransferase 1
MKKIAIFASGSGSNAQVITEYFIKRKSAEINCILCNNKDAYVLERSKSLNIQYFIFGREDLYENSAVLNILKKRGIDFIVLAGFLWLMPGPVINKFGSRIVNIHPALLPKYGGKGMYGMKVHQAVIDNKEKESGITIHYVNEKYDDGDIIFQAKCSVDSTDTPETLAQKIHILEHTHYPRVIDQLVSNLDTQNYD